MRAGTYYQTTNYNGNDLVVMKSNIVSDTRYTVIKFDVPPSLKNGCFLHLFVVGMDDNQPSREISVRKLWANTWSEETVTYAKLYRRGYDESVSFVADKSHVGKWLQIEVSELIYDRDEVVSFFLEIVGEIANSGNYITLGTTEKGNGPYLQKSVPTPSPSMSSSEEPSELPSEGPSEVPTLDFDGIEDAYSFTLGEIDISWDVPYYQDDVAELEGVVYHIFVALGMFDYTSALMDRSVEDLIPQFQDFQTSQYHSVSGATLEIELNSAYVGELHSLLVVAELDGLFSKNTLTTRIRVSDTSPKLREGVEIKGIFVPSEDLQITLGTPNSIDLPHNLSFAGSLEQEHLALSVGDNIFGFNSKACNFLRNIVAVEESSNDLLVLSVVMIPLEAAFEELDLEASLPMSHKMHGVIRSSRRKLFFDDAFNWVKRQVKKAVDFLSEATKTVINVIGKGVEFIKGLVDGEFGESFTIIDINEKFEEELVPDHVTLSGNMDFETKLQVSVKISLERLYADVSLAADYEFGTRLDFEGSSSEENEKTVNLFSGTPLRFWLGVIEINVRPNVDLVTKVEASYDATAHFEVEYYGGSSFGVVADTSSDNKVDTKFVAPTFEQRTFSVDLDGKAEITASVALVLKASVGVYDQLLSAEAGLSIGLKFGAAGGSILINEETPIVYVEKFDVDIELGIPLSASALYGKYPLAQTNIYENSWPILRLPTADINISNNLSCLKGTGENGSNFASLELGLSKKNAESKIPNEFVNGVRWYGEDLDTWDLSDTNSDDYLTISNKNVISSTSPLPTGKIYVTLEQQVPPVIKRLYTVELNELVDDTDAVECLDAVGEGLQRGEECPSINHVDCFGNLKCGKRSKDDETYICCDQTYVPSGWTTDVCGSGLQKGEECPSTNDDDCVGDLECGKRSKDDETYICCEETHVPFLWTTDVCK